MTFTLHSLGSQTSPFIAGFFDPATFTVTYLVADLVSGQAAVIDPVLDFDPASGRVTSSSADAVLALAHERGFQLLWVLETHAHADHLSAAQYVKAKTGADIGIGAHITDVQSIFAPLFAATDVHAGGGDFDLLFEDGDQFALGDLTVSVLHTPGHTPADVSYAIGDAVFVGDTIFMPDYGTARADFPGGNAEQLYASIQKLLALPPQTQLFCGHDYKAPGRDHYAWVSSVAEQAAANIHVGGGITADAFVEMRQARDAGLAAPRLLLPSIQTNIRAGRLPPADADGQRRLRLPLRGEAALLAVL
jgi:glyoxylase-like metal-dependent hydrolase (beta-lactamase superfamily II)